MNSQLTSEDLKSIRASARNVIRSQHFKLLKWNVLTLLSTFIILYNGRSLILAYLLNLGSAFVWLRVIQSSDPVEFSKSLRISDSTTGINTLLNVIRHFFLTLYRFVITILWFLLLIVPGIYKSIMYSFVNHVYYDHVDTPKHKTFKECLKMSETLMKSNIKQYLILIVPTLLTTSIIFAILLITTRFLLYRVNVESQPIYLIFPLLSGIMLWIYLFISTVYINALNSMFYDKASKLKG